MGKKGYLTDWIEKNKPPWSIFILSKSKFNETNNLSFFPAPQNADVIFLIEFVKIIVSVFAGIKIMAAYI